LGGGGAGAGAGAGAGGGAGAGVGAGAAQEAKTPPKTMMPRTMMLGMINRSFLLFILPSFFRIIYIILLKYRFVNPPNCLKKVLPKGGMTRGSI